MGELKSIFKWGRIPLYSGLMIVILLGGGCALRAQKTQKQDIRNAYETVNLRIERCKDEGAPCGLYLNQIQTNQGEEPWAVVGTYESTRDLWYQRADAEEESFQLLKANVETYRSSRRENEEFLFSPTGNLEFFYFRVGEGDDLLQEFRFYFSKGKLIDYQEKLEEGEAEYREWSRENGDKVLENAKALQQLLQATL